MAWFKMSTLALKWALKRPPTRRYPFHARVAIPESRGKLIFTKDHCVYCTVCAKKCPAGAIEVVRAEKRWTLDRLRCIHCGSCVEVCPKKSLQFITTHVGAYRKHELESH